MIISTIIILISASLSRSLSGGKYCKSSGSLSITSSSNSSGPANGNKNLASISISESNNNDSWLSDRKTVNCLVKK